MNNAFWESDELEPTDEFWADDADEESDQLPHAGGEAVAPVADDPKDAAEPLPDHEVLDELRKRESALVALKACLLS